MIRMAAALFTAALLSAPAAGADPSNLVPACSGQLPETGQCTAPPVESANPLEGFFGDAPGGNPNTPAVLTPQFQPVIIPLGLTPANLPVVFPLGVTPPNVVPGR